MDPQSEADKIRNKRLAKLGGTQSSENTSPSSPVATATSSTSPSTSTSTKEEPPRKSDPSSISSSMPQINVKPLIPSTAKPASKKQESPEEWANRTLCSIFRVTLQQSQKQDTDGNKLIFLENTRQELQTEGLPLLLRIEGLEPVIIEAASQTGSHPLRYLMGCWKRVNRIWRVIQSKGQSNSQYQVIKEARRLCLSYCIFAITVPDLFGIDKPDKNILVSHLLANQEDDYGICPDFLSAIATQIDEDDSLNEAFVEAIEELSLDLRKLTMNDDFKPYVFALMSCLNYPPLTTAITRSPNFLNKDLPAEKLERRTILGPFFALSPLKPEVAVNYFMGASAQGQTYVLNGQNAVRMSLRTLQEELYSISNSIIKTSKETREKLLDWFALVLNKNHKRRATWVNDKIVSTDGFMVNITTILDRLCDPFMRTTLEKLEKIDVNYLRRSPRLEITDETKLNADQATSDKFYSLKDEKENNFISEVFFLTAAAHHYGTEATNNRLSQLQREVKHLASDIEQLEGVRPTFATDAIRRQQLENRLTMAKNSLERAKCVIEAINGILSDEITQNRSMLFMRYIIAWLLRLVQPESNYPQKSIKLPLSEDQPMVFRCLPEYFLEDVVDNFKFITNRIPHLILPEQCKEIVTICITFLRSTDYVKNPGIKSGLITILFYGIWPSQSRPRGVLGDHLNSLDFCHENLLQALMQFYIEAESTGTHTQFYDKFNIRYEIFQIFKAIWSNEIYRNRLERESRVNPDFFVRFVNLLLNDATYVLNESLRSFQKIHEIQNLLRDPNNGLNEEQRKEKEELLESTKQTAKGSMQLTNETVAMLKLFTEAIPAAFTAPEIVQRLADMLDYNLDLMVSNKQKELVVEDRDQYHFRPQVLLTDLMSVYINLKDQNTFLVAVARDARSYIPKNFDQAATIAHKRSGMSVEEHESWIRLVAAIAKAKEIEDQEVDDLGEIPDEFLDPLLYTLMEDPVLLPTSKITIDRSTIRSHLLSDPQDPFNRQPLKIEDVIPDTEMKAKIDKFKFNAKAKRRASITDPEVMDTS